MKTTMLPEQPDAKSPAGVDIRYLMDGVTGNMIHSTVPPHQINKATVHATVSEFWYVLEGNGQIWRDDGVESCIVDFFLAPRLISRWRQPSGTGMCQTKI